jgi:hypothetical protein
MPSHNSIKSVKLNGIAQASIFQDAVSFETGLAENSVRQGANPPK